MYYHSQKGYGLKDLFRNISRPFKPLLKPVLEGVKDVGLNLAGDLIGDLVSGKTSKASIKARGKQAKDMAVQCALQSFQGGRGNFNGNLPPSSLGWSGKTAKRKRSRSKSQTPAKRKRSQSKRQPVNRSQTGGIYPPIHYPGGNYPGYDRIMKGRGFFSNIYKNFKKKTGGGL